MGMICRWIDERCKAQPEVMRRVLGRRFGTLAQFAEGDKCGCLVGSWELESIGRVIGFDTRSRIDTHVGYAVSALTKPYTTPSPHGIQAFRDFPHLGSPNVKRPDAFVIRLLKQRIRKSLGIAPVVRETGVVGAHPERISP